LDFDKKIK